MHIINIANDGGLKIHKCCECLVRLKKGILNEPPTFELRGGHGGNDSRPLRGILPGRLNLLALHLGILGFEPWEGAALGPLSEGMRGPKQGWLAPLKVETPTRS